MSRSSWKSFVITQEEISTYARLSGDCNPIHFDEKEARLAGLAGPCAHGMYVISKILGMLQIQEGKTSFTFLTPILVGELVFLRTVQEEEILSAQVFTEGKLAIRGKILVQSCL